MLSSVSGRGPCAEEERDRGRTSPFSMRGPFAASKEEGASVQLLGRARPVSVRQRARASVLRKGNELGREDVRIRSSPSAVHEFCRSAQLSTCDRSEIERA